MSDKPKDPESANQTRPDAKGEEARDDALLQSILKPRCDLCGSMMVEWHCRMMCPACGYQRDCSDP